MKKVILMSALVAIFGFSTQASATQAVVITDEFCGMLDGAGGSLVTNDTKRTATGSPNGNTMFQCRTDLPSHDGGAYNFNYDTSGIYCGVLTQNGFVVTQDWQARLPLHVDITAINNIYCCTIPSLFKKLI